MPRPMRTRLPRSTPARHAAIIPIRPATDRTIEVVTVSSEQLNGSAVACPLQPDTVNAVVQLHNDDAIGTSTQRVFALNILCVLLRN
jgi:hypothetical protein